MFGEFRSTHRYQSATERALCFGALFAASAVLHTHEAALAQPICELWSQQVAGPVLAEDMTGGAVDDSGYVVMTGNSEGSGGTYDFLTVKISPSGDTVWSRRVGGPFNNFAWALGADSACNVYVAGSVDFVGGNPVSYLVKYSPSGTELWNRQFAPLGFPASSLAIAVSRDGDAYAGGSAHDGSTYAFTVVGYGSSGDTLWIGQDRGPENLGGNVRAITLGAGDTVYAAGDVSSSTIQDIHTVKFLPSGDTAWCRTYDGPGAAQDDGRAVCVDSSGNVYVAGTTSGSNRDFVLLKYLPNGDTAWVRQYNGPADGDDELFNPTLAVDSAGNVFISGMSYGGAVNNFDVVTVKYSPSGDTLWTRRHNGSGNGPDEARQLWLDSAGNVYVTGASYSSGTGSDKLVLKYSGAGTLLWTTLYDGPDHFSDWGTLVAVDPSGDFYVMGASVAFATGADFSVVKYSQFRDLDTDGLGDACDNCPYTANALQEDGDANDIGDACQIGDPLVITLYSPVDMVVTDPYGDSIGLDSAGSATLFNTILNGSVYDTAGDFNFDTHKDDRVIIPSPAAGPYSIRIIREPSASDSATFTMGIRIDGNQQLFPEGYADAAVSALGTAIPETYVWNASTIYTGDINSDGNYTASDIILLVNYVFKGGTPPDPPSLGDVNCSNTVTSADIIGLVNFIFKAGARPCSGSAG